MKKEDRYLIHGGFIFHGICYFHHRRMEPLDLHFKWVHVTQQLIRFSSGQAFNTTKTTVRAQTASCCQPPEVRPQWVCECCQGDLGGKLLSFLLGGHMTKD